MHARSWLAFALIAASAGTWAAAVTYRTPQDFLSETFDGRVPEPQVVWLTDAVRADMKRILGADMSGARVRYWRRGTRTAWVLDEIGKEAPITTGIVVEDGHIVRFDVLIYRESRGGEVRFPYFRQQFDDASLTAAGTLDRHIDGITGATLSVHSMTTMARRALYLDALVMRAERP